MFRVPRHSLRFDLLTAVLLATLLLRALTPVGYMPGDGPLSLKFCTTSGLVDVVLRLPADPSQAPSQDGADHGDSICSFGSAPASAPEPASLAVRIEFDAGATAADASPEQGFFPRTIVREQSPRGPPSPA